VKDWRDLLCQVLVLRYPHFSCERPYRMWYVWLT